MLKLNLEKYHSALQFRDEEGVRKIFDPVRRKHYLVQPEELVRQSWIQYLMMEKGITSSSLGVEKSFKVNNVQRRYDLVLYRKAEAYVLFEFKSFKKKINNDTAFQAAQYNLQLRVPYIIISNGIVHYAFALDFENKSFTALDDLSFLEF